MATPTMPRRASSSSQPFSPSLLPPVPCSTTTAGREPGRPVPASRGRTISTGTRSTPPSAFASLAKVNRSYVSPSRVTAGLAGRTSGATRGRSSILRNAAPASAGGSGFRPWPKAADAASSSNANTAGGRMGGSFGSFSTKPARKAPSRRAGHRQDRRRISRFRSGLVTHAGRVCYAAAVVAHASRVCGQPDRYEWSKGPSAKGLRRSLTAAARFVSLTGPHRTVRCRP